MNIRLAQLGNHSAVALAVAELQRYLKMMDPTLALDILQMDHVSDQCGKVIWVGVCEEGKALLLPHRPAFVYDGGGALG